MAKRIWKYMLELKDEQTIMMPAGAMILSVQTQKDMPMLWAMVDPTRAFSPRRFAVFGTGSNEFDANGLAFLGTIQQRAGGLVWHVFERMIYTLPLIDRPIMGRENG